jgi:hypothetical protein
MVSLSSLLIDGACVEPSADSRCMSLARGRNLYLGSMRRFPPPWSVEELAAMSDTRPMTPEQAATLKQLAKAAYELDAFKPTLTCAEADLRIAMLTAKLKLLDGPPHTL